MHGLQIVNTKCGVSEVTACISLYVGQRRTVLHQEPIGAQEGEESIFIALLNGTYTSVVPKVGAAAKAVIHSSILSVHTA